MEAKLASDGAPGGNRTPDPQLRRLLLYPTELLARFAAPHRSAKMHGATRCPAESSASGEAVEFNRIRSSRPHRFSARREGVASATAGSPQNGTTRGGVAHCDTAAHSLRPFTWPRRRSDPMPCSARWCSTLVRWCLSCPGTAPARLRGLPRARLPFHRLALPGNHGGS
jgi:hypothetical protein